MTTLIAAPKIETLQEVKVRAVREALDHTKGDVAATARLLGVARSTVYRIMHDAEIAPSGGTRQ